MEQNRGDPSVPRVQGHLHPQPTTDPWAGDAQDVQGAAQDPPGLSLSPSSGGAGMSLGALALIPLPREAQIPCLCCQAELQLSP